MSLRRILIVDDDPDIRRITALSLARIGGFSVVAAASAEEALAKAAEELPDVILLDVSMPGADGPTTLATLRATARTARVPVIFFTAEADDERAAQLCALGAMGVITKPFDLAGLPGRIRDMLSGSGLE
ncbi:MAG: response regulator [Myxococcota bacterium]|nr:response regulator [Myxococcota bacterium]